MEHQNCPYLGLKEDPDTHLGFPSGGNICLRTSTATSISNHHQSDFCLSARTSSCPNYLPQLSIAETGANTVTQESTPTITMTATSTITITPTQVSPTRH
jgi:hypothetical protein